MKKLTKVLSVVLALLMIALTFAGCSQKTEKEPDSEVAQLQYKIENNEVIITGFTDSTERPLIVVPDEIEGLPVTQIADYSLFNSDTVTKITIGKNVKTIGTWSMTNNQRLKEFVVDKDNENFTAVDGILFSKDMKTIYYYPNAKDITFDKFGNPVKRDKPWEPKEIDYKGEDGKIDKKKFEKDYAEYEKKLADFQVINYTIPDGVETISSKCFYKCYYIDKVAIPDSVKDIQEKAFHRCSSLDELVLPQSLEHIGKDAFAYCNRIYETVIPSNIKNIDEYAFFFCDNMKKIDIQTAEKNVELGNNWFPTNNGRQIKDCEIIFK